MADITQIFKSTVKMIKVRHKTVESMKAGAGDETTGDVSSGSASFTQSAKSAESDDSFSANIRDLVMNISNLKVFLIKNRKAYLAASSNMPLENGQSKLSDAERDKIDTDSMAYIKLCKETLAKYKPKALHKQLSSQHREHRTLVFSMVEEYLKVVCTLYSEQKAIRVKRAVDKQKLSALELQKPERRQGPGKAPSASGGSTSFRKQADVSVFDEPVSSEADADQITAEEAQMFKEENEQLYNEFNATLDEVRQIEGKVIEISKLQEIFTEKVLEQDGDINRISDQVVDSTENIVQGNDDIREAMKNNTGLRVWIIFGICVLSFSLLFLDWYND